MQPGFLFKARCMIAGVLIAFSLFLAVCQIMAIVAARRRLNADPNARGYSMVPILVGLLGTIECLVAPYSFVQRLWWVPLIIDPGCALLFGSVLLLALVNLVRRFISRKT